MLNIGDVELGHVVRIPFNTFDSDGASVTVTDLANTDVHIHKDGNVLQFDNYDAITVSINYDGVTGNHLVIIDTGDSGLVADFEEGSDYMVRLEGMTVVTQTLNVWIGMFSIVNRAGNVTHINGNTAPVDNLEDQFDGTGLSGNTFPATQAQVSGIANTGAATNIPAIAEPNGFVITTGTNEGNNEDSTQALDGVVHSIDDNGSGVLDVHYIFDIGGVNVPVSVTLTGRVNGGNDSLDVFVNTNTIASPSWVQRGILSGKGGSSNDTVTFTLFTTDLMVGADAGKVAFRFQNTGLTTATLSIDQIYCSVSTIADPTGYSNSRIFVDTNASNTNTVVDVDGTGRNPVSTWAAALILNSSLGFDSFTIANGSTITLSGNSDNYTLDGEGWTLDLSGESISAAHFKGANVTGTGTGASHPRFDHCHFGNVTLPPSDSEGCVLEGIVIAGSAGDFFFEQCQSGVAGTSTPVFDFGSGLNSSNLNFRDYSGGIEIRNMGAGSGNYDMSLEGDGQLVVNANCSTTSTIAIRGHYTITGDSTAIAAITFSDDARIDIGQINNEVDTAIEDAGLDKLDSMITEDSAGNYFTEEALAEAPTAEMDDSELHTALDSYANKNDYKATGFNIVTPDVAGTAATLHGVTDGKIDGLVTPDASGTAAALHTTTDGKVDTNKDILDKLDNMITEDSAGNEFTTEALANAPSGSGGDATAANQITILSRIGTPANIDGGGADLSNNIKKLADDNGGATFDAEHDSLNKLHDNELTTIAGDVANIDGSAMIGTNGANTTVPDAAGIAATPAEVASALNTYGANKTTPPTVAQIRTQMEIDGGKLDHLWETTENDGGVRRFSENALEEAPSGAGLTATQNTALILIRNIIEGDATIDTSTTPWQLVIKTKSTETEILKKDLKSVAGINIAAVSTVIGQVLEP